jgi:hypothetical protein
LVAHGLGIAPGPAEGAEIMRKHTGFLIGSILLGLGAGTAFAVEPTRMAQSEPGSSFQRQRAPGVPLSPSPSIVEQRESARVGDSMGSRPRNVRQANSGSQVDRDPPMPRGVPSIIAP